MRLPFSPRSGDRKTARPSCLLPFKGLVGRFMSDRRGGAAILFGIAALPLLLMAGAAVDYTYASRVKVRLDNAADMAALSAVNRSSMALSAEAAKTVAVNTFTADAGTQDRTVLTSTSVTIGVSGTLRTAEVAYSATVSNVFMGLGGISTTTVSGTVKATSAVPLYIDFYLLLDNSPSMGVGATTADINKLIANTSDKCAFACHITGSTSDYYALAKKLGVAMRIDVVRTATQSLMDTATSMLTVAGQYRAAIYTFGSSCTKTGLTTISTLTASLSSAKTAASAIDLMAIPYQGYNNDQCTDFDNILAAANTAIPTPGDGTSAASPQKILFFVTDGVADYYYPSTCTEPTTSGRCQEPLTTAICTKIKARGIRIAVLYTTYIPLTTNAWYNTWIKPFQSKIPTNMEACASSGLYFEVSPSSGISEAMTALFQKAVASARLTQ